MYNDNKKDRAQDVSPIEKGDSLNNSFLSSETNMSSACAGDPRLCQFIKELFSCKEASEQQCRRAITDLIDSRSQDILSRQESIENDIEKRYDALSSKAGVQQNSIDALTKRMDELDSKVEKLIEETSKIPAMLNELKLKTESNSNTHRDTKERSFFADRSMPAQDGDFIEFYDFSIMPSFFSCTVRSSKRSENEKIEFRLSKPGINLNNNLIACALSTLCGKAYKGVYIDLVINEYTINRLSAFTGAKWYAAFVSSLDATQKERTGLILNFSGGFDSLAAKSLLPDETQLVSVDWGSAFTRETQFFSKFDPLICSTNFRKYRFDRESWTFMGVGAILYSEALNAKYNVFGSIFEATTYNFKVQKCDINVPEKAFKVEPFVTAGMQGIQIISGLTEVATAMLVTYYYPHYVTESLKSLAPVGSEKLYRKQVLTDIVCRRYSRDIGSISFDMPNEKKEALPFGTVFARDFLALYELKHAGKDVVGHTVTNIPDEVTALVNESKLDFYEKLNPAFIASIPLDMRQEYLAKLKAADVEVFDDNDWKEWESVKQLLSKYYPDIK